STPRAAPGGRSSATSRCSAAPAGAPRGA
ncbi:MAG: hypothetical protein AVDCRST_MAG30-2148, partial [uncultured Solirubrobacteraceae bacterium]